MASKALLTVAEAILDPAIEDYRDVNLKDAQAVQAYAENGMETVLDDAEADTIRAVCWKWLRGVDSGILNGTDDYYHHVEQPLNNYDEIDEIKLVVGKEPKTESDLNELAIALNRADELNEEEEDDHFITIDHSDLPLDSRCRQPYATSELWSWADPDADGVPKYVLLHDDGGDLGWQACEIGDDDTFPRTHWSKEQ